MFSSKKWVFFRAFMVFLFLAAALLIRFAIAQGGVVGCCSARGWDKPPARAACCLMCCIVKKHQQGAGFMALPVSRHGRIGIVHANNRYTIA